jgi:hypothetical protein
MMTVRQIERLWNAKAYEKLAHHLLAARQEGRFGLEEVDRPSFAAALAIIRLDEFNQSYHPLYTTLVRALLAAQDRDGGWGDPPTTGICLRALLIGRGDGAAIERGLGYLATLQKDHGIWPAGPLRRMPEDPAASLFILYQLADNPRFRQAIRFADALNWFAENNSMLSSECQRLSAWASLRWRNATAGACTSSLFAA